MLTLAKTDLTPLTQQCMVRFQRDMKLLQKLTSPEVRAVYHELEWVRDELSKLLDKADHKHV
jgi:hypothetical protein